MNGVNDLNKNLTSISIPKQLADKIKERIKGTPFNTVSSYMTFIMRLILLEKKDGDEAFTKKDEENVKSKLWFSKTALISASESAGSLPRIKAKVCISHGRRFCSWYGLEWIAWDVSFYRKLFFCLPSFLCFFKQIHINVFKPAVLLVCNSKRAVLQGYIHMTVEH